MSRKIVLSIVGVLAAVFYLSSVAAAAGPNTDPRCLGLTGAAFGMCQAATAVGCDDPATRDQGCALIEDNYTQITGEQPTWTSLCPCSEYFYLMKSYMYQRPGNASCQRIVASPGVLSIHFEFYDGLGCCGDWTELQVWRPNWSYSPLCKGITEVTGYPNWILIEDLTQEAVEDCANEIESIAIMVGIECEEIQGPDPE